MKIKKSILGGNETFTTFGLPSFYFVYLIYTDSKILESGLMQRNFYLTAENKYYIFFFWFLSNKCIIRNQQIGSKLNITKNKTEYHSVQTAGQNYDLKELCISFKNPKEP